MRCLYCKKPYTPINGFGHGKNFCDSCINLFSIVNHSENSKKYKEANRASVYRHRLKGMHTSSLLKLKERYGRMLAVIDVRQPTIC